MGILEIILVTLCLWILMRNKSSSNGITITYTTTDNVSVTVNGNIQTCRTGSADVTIYGDVDNLSTRSGGSVRTGSGDINYG